jgi:DNA-binding transcriptional MerR regulator
LYRKKDVELILWIKHLLYEKKFTIEGAKQKLKTKSTGQSEKLSTDILQEICSELQKIRDLLT